MAYTPHDQWTKSAPFRKGDTVQIDPKMIYYVGADNSVRAVPNDEKLSGNRAELVVIDDWGPGPAWERARYASELKVQTPYLDALKRKGLNAGNGRLLTPESMKEIDRATHPFWHNYADSAKPSMLHLAEYRWHEVRGGTGISLPEGWISAEQLTNEGANFDDYERVSNELHFYRKKEPKVPRAKKVREVQFNTIGVRFIDGHNLAKVYTYRVPKKAKLHLGQEVVVPVDKAGNGNIVNTIAVVVELHKARQDTLGYDYKEVVGTVKPL